MSTVIVTGSAGLVGSEASEYYASQGYDVVGIDNDMRKTFFGPGASTIWRRRELESSLKSYRHEEADIRDQARLREIFRAARGDIALVLHAAAQPSHDWAARDPHADFGVNAVGTLNMLEVTRELCPETPFAFLSTNKVYGDTPNRLPLVEKETRWELDPSHAYAQRGIDETMSIDQTTHSLFGVSKLSADALVQEYGRYFGMKTAAFRAGCITGPAHSGTELHGFLSYMMKCAVTGTHYNVYGYKGKQVRDNIHGLDLVRAIDAFRAKPRSGEVYNMGGGRAANCSLVEAVALSEEISGNKLSHSYVENNRIGDHIWWISDTSKFERHYPSWKIQHSVRDLLRQIHEHNAKRWLNAPAVA